MSMSSLSSNLLNVSLRFHAIAWLCVAIAFLIGCGEQQADRTPDGRVIVYYWEKWTGFEADAMRAVVDDFNASQDDVFVKMLSVSGVDQKLLLAAAGGNPPDVAGVWTHTISVFAEKGALTPLDSYAASSGISRDDYIPAIYDQCTHRDHLWALPTTPATIALHWNKSLFEEAGLDPDKPPRDIEEFERYVERLTIVEQVRDGKLQKLRYDELTDAEKQAKDFNIIQLGHNPRIPGWWLELWGFWFDGRMWDGDRQITIQSPENVETYEWFRSYPQRFGRRNLDTFGASFGNFASPQDPFLSGQVAMVIQGEWMYNFIDQYAPQMRWGAAPFPAARFQADAPVTVLESDVLVIPRGARHPEAAFQFITYVNSQKAIEKLNIGQRKFSPLAQVSDEFFAKHPNKHIKVFIDLASSPRAHAWPTLPIWNEYKDEVRIATDRIYAGDISTQQALTDVYDRAQLKLDRAMHRWDMVAESRLAEWGAYDQR